MNDPIPHENARDPGTTPARDAPQSAPPPQPVEQPLDAPLAAPLPPVPPSAELQANTDISALPTAPELPIGAESPSAAANEAPKPPGRLQQFLAFVRRLLQSDAPPTEPAPVDGELREDLRLYFPLGTRTSQHPDKDSPQPALPLVRNEHRRVNPFLGLDLSEFSINQLRCQLRAEGRAINFPPHPLPPTLLTWSLYQEPAPIQPRAARPVSDALLKADLTLDGMPLAWQERDVELLEKRRQQPYDVQLRGLRLSIAESVFPPEFGASSQMLEEALRDLVHDMKHPGIRSALDMGTGSGFLAIALAKAGVPDVWAVDLHQPAVACAEANAQANGVGSVVRVLHSDLFGALPVGRKFDLIVFNQPYYPTPNETFGPAKDGGREIIHRFLRSTTNRLFPGGIILMPFSPQIAGTEHNPAGYCQELGFRARVLSFHVDARGRHLIWAIQREVRKKRPSAAEKRRDEGTPPAVA